MYKRLALHRPKCDPSGMAYLGNGLWADIYLASDDGANGLQSVYNATPITGTEGLNWYIANEKAARVGKRLPDLAEWLIEMCIRDRQMMKRRKKSEHGLKTRFYMMWTMLNLWLMWIVVLFVR